MIDLNFLIKSVLFEELDIGECFMNATKTSVFMKIPGARKAGDIPVNAVFLSDGHLIEFKDEDKVFPVKINAELSIK